jgi:Ca-activated chloride channel family protein
VTIEPPGTTSRTFARLARRNEGARERPERRGHQRTRPHAQVGPAVLLGALVLAAGAISGQQQGPPEREPQAFRFRSGVELINVTATVTDVSGRFVPRLRAEDFIVSEDGVPQPITHFSNERVPVSLGIALDTSGSMAGERLSAARRALDRFLGDLLGGEDEVFLYRFSDRPQLVEPWTTNRERLRRMLAGIGARGGTALYDAVAEAVPLAQTGARRKKALLVISDGNDTTSETRPERLTATVRETEVLIYAIAIDAPGEDSTWTGRMPQGRPPLPIPFPIPGRRPGGWPGSPPTYPPGYPPTGGGGGSSTRGGDRANITALRELTDGSGGRTEVIRDSRDIEPATTSIADELSQQYYLAYPSPQLRDGRWHSIDVRVKHGNYRVRARRGYIATP